MNQEAELKLGQLMIAMAQRCSFVRFSIETSVLHGHIYIVQMMKVVNGKTLSNKETINEESLIKISDVQVVADALMKGMKAS
jgi:hypothetical protein